MSDITSCPLCAHTKTQYYYEDKHRIYQQCLHCLLIFVELSFHLNWAAEKSVYDLHQNSPHDQGYCKFLNRLVAPFLERLPPQQRGLDFGCGPGPTISTLLEKAGHQVCLYDPFYFPNPDVFKNCYDFVSATEVIEHLSHPAQVFAQLFALLKPGGWLGLMTKMVKNKAAFQNWHYIRDLTHVCFYSPATFEYIAATFQAELYIEAKDVIIMKRQA